LETPADELKDHTRWIIEPLDVVEKADQGTLGRCLRQQAKHRETDDESLWGGAGCNPECDAQGLLLRLRQCIDSRKDRAAELLDGGEWHFELRLDSRDLHHAATGGLTGAVLQERCLANPSLPAYDPGRALTGTDAIEHAIESSALARPPHKTWGPAGHGPNPTTWPQSRQARMGGPGRAFVLDTSQRGMVFSDARRNRQQASAQRYRDAAQGAGDAW
jgi:hypothetical protein